MLPPAGSSRAEQWVAGGRTACAKDLVSRLSSVESIERIIALVGEKSDRKQLAHLGVDVRLSGEVPFEFGREIARLVETEQIDELAYFGGASAPLLEASALQELVDRVSAAPERFGIANNLHSTDWLLVNDAQAIAAHSHRLPSDNPFGWVLSREAGFKIESVEPSAASRLDIDTPSDLFLAWGHPAVGRNLAGYLKNLEPEIVRRIERIREVIGTPASTVAIIGRASAGIWKALVDRTQIWVRVFAEERGMVASHRLSRGEVRSLVATMLDESGPSGFVERLSGMADAVLWDTRVWMGTQSKWPGDADRFASDFGWVDQIEHKGLRELTAAINDSPVPILAGGYGVVGGGLYALLESLDQG